MQYTISHRMSDVHGSAIRELFKLGADPSMISFGGGNPSAETFPVPEIAEIMADVMKNAPVSVLQYGLSEGYTPLRDTMKKYLARTQGFDFEKNELFIVSGGQQCADLTTKVLVNEGDVILTEDPAFVGCLNTFRSYGAKLVGVPMQQDGMDIDALEAALKANPNAKLLYTIPSFQNPSGITTTLEKRKKVYELACRYDIAILEDNPYGELRFEGEYMPALKSLDTKGLVIYLGTFSKILAPGYRLGWVCAEDEILAKYNFMEQAASLQASTIGQMETSKWIDMFDLDAHVNTIRECYRKRRAVMLETLAKELPEPCTFTRPDGGLFAWVVLPEYMDAKDLQMKCLAKKVAFVPGGSFFPNGGHDNTLRLNYSCMPEEKIVKGITALCQTIRENLR